MGLFNPHNIHIVLVRRHLEWQFRVILACKCIIYLELESFLNWLAIVDVYIRNRRNRNQVVDFDMYVELVNRAYVRQNEGLNLMTNIHRERRRPCLLARSERVVSYWMYYFPLPTKFTTTSHCALNCIKSTLNKYCNLSMVIFLKHPFCFLHRIRSTPTVISQRLIIPAHIKIIQSFRFLLRLVSDGVGLFVTVHSFSSRPEPTTICIVLEYIARKCICENNYEHNCIKRLYILCTYTYRNNYTQIKDNLHTIVYYFRPLYDFLDVDINFHCHCFYSYSNFDQTLCKVINIRRIIYILTHSGNQLIALFITLVVDVWESLKHHIKFMLDMIQGLWNSTNLRTFLMHNAELILKKTWIMLKWQ